MPHSITLSTTPCQTVFYQDLDHKKRLKSWQKTCLVRPLNKHRIPLSNSRNALQIELIPGAMGSPLGVLGRQVSILKPVNLSFKKLNQKLMQKVLSTAHKSTDEKLDRVFATNTRAMLDASLKLDNCSKIKASHYLVCKRSKRDLVCFSESER